MNLLSKISAKGVMGNVIGQKAVITAELAKGEKYGFRIVGLVKSTFSVVTQFGDSTGFKGTFEAVNIRTGEAFRAGKCFLPTIATDLLESAVDGMGEDQTELRFGFEIGLIPSDKGSTGYEFTVKPLIDTTENDPVAELRQQFLQIEAPKAAPKAEPAKADKK